MSKVTLTKDVNPPGYHDVYTVSNVPKQSIVRIKNENGEDCLQIRICTDNKGQKHLRLTMTTTEQFGFRNTCYEFIDGILVKVGSPY